MEYGARAVRGRAEGCEGNGKHRMNEMTILGDIRALFEAVLGERLTGIYVHGSIAFGCFNWERSDIDFLAVVNAPLEQGDKEKLIRGILEIDARCPANGIEMSVVRGDALMPFVYPTPYELHFSNYYRERFREDISGWCAQLNGVDRDLAAHVTVVNKVGIALCGREIADVFGAVPAKDYLDSILYDVENAREDILENPVYCALNLCRVLAYVESGLVLSKKQGGQWGIRNVPAEFEAVVRGAYDAYCSGAEFTQNGMLYEFADYMLKRVKK